MKLGIYPRLALNSIRKNKRLYTPYILTCSGMIMMFYIMAFLAKGKAVETMLGANFIYLTLNLGCIVIGIFSAIFLFYTNSFLIKRRKKEFGLYNILGMGKPNLALVLTCESTVITILSLTVGLFFGILFSKFAELIMVNILKLETNFTFTVEWQSVAITIILFTVIFLLLLVNTLRQIRISEPIELLRSENAGEKPPKSNTLIAVFGALILAGAYGIAVTIKDPVAALILFFVAVVMVIISTYMLFIAGSVSVCKTLQKNKKYYYKTNHFVSVSSMIYRMKRNGAGLASICILCTMVLVMLSSTICLYTGTENSLKERYMRNIYIEMSAKSDELLDSKTITDFKDFAFRTASEANQTPENILDYREAEFVGEINDTQISPYSRAHTTSAFVNIAFVHILSLEDYNRAMYQNEVLEENEAFIYCARGLEYTQPDITIGNTSYQVKRVLTEFSAKGNDAMNSTPSIFLVVNNPKNIVNQFLDLADFYGNGVLTFRQYYCYDLNCEDKEQVSIYENILNNKPSVGESQITVLFACMASERAGFYDMFGSLFFLGILLGIVFVFAAVLIIYYKQISEGYEDQSRFEIMQKVGMNKNEIKKSINSQVLTVFFLPLAMSAVHLGFAFPMIYKMLSLFSITNLRFLILITLACFALFSLFYVLVYKITSKAYYSIVINTK